MQFDMYIVLLVVGCAVKDNFGSVAIDSKFYEDTLVPTAVVYNHILVCPGASRDDIGQWFTIEKPIVPIDVRMTVSGVKRLGLNSYKRVNHGLIPSYLGTDHGREGI
jgi:hypothetical protein